MNRFIARGQNADKTITVIMTISNEEKLHADAFLESLKHAISTYITYNENGRRMWEYSGGEFNFADLAIAAHDGYFLSIADKYRLFDLKVELVQNNQADFDLDMNLAK